MKFNRLSRALRAQFEKTPWLKRFIFKAIDTAAFPILSPFSHPRPEPTKNVSALEAMTDPYNVAAESYYAKHPSPDKLLQKPFGEGNALFRRFVEIGLLLEAARVRPGDTVLELGAGTCWLSLWLNRYGCPTVSVDVSQTALALGRKLFERDPETNWNLKPEFKVYDGWTLPLPDGSVDRVVLYDAFHHLPNQERLLLEMRRVLTNRGIVGMSEPGRGHSTSAESVSEATTTGVLENELVLEDLAALAQRCGFSASRVLLSPGPYTREIDALDLRSFMRGRGFSEYWKGLCNALDKHHYLLLFAGNPEPTTERPKQLNARIDLKDIRQSEISVQRQTPIHLNVDTYNAGDPIRHWYCGHERQSEISVQRQTPIHLNVDIYNAGDTTWLHESHEPGWTRLGVHLYRDDATRSIVDFDWVRVSLPHDVPPEYRVRIDLILPPVDDPGSYVVMVDLVIENECWFADRGSSPFVVYCRVE